MNFLSFTYLNEKYLSTIIYKFFFNDNINLTVCAM